MVRRSDAPKDADPAQYRKMDKTSGEYGIEPSDKARMEATLAKIAECTTACRKLRDSILAAMAAQTR